MVCPVCGTENPPDYLYCQKCGAMRPGSSLSGEEATRVGEAPVQGNVPPPQMNIPTPPVPPSYPPYAEPSPPPPAEKKSKLPLIILGVGLIIACLIVAIGAVLYFVIWNGQVPANINLPFLSGGRSTGSRIIIGFPNSRDESELYVLKMGDPIEKGALFLEDMKPSQGYIYEWENFRGIGSYSHTFGGFTPDGKRIIATYQDNDTNITSVYNISAKESTVILESDYDLYTYLMPDQSTLFFWENRDSNWYTYLSRNWQEAERMSKTNDSYLSNDGTSLLIIDTNSNYETTLSFKKFSDPDNEVILVEDEENVENYALSGDGSLVYYTVNDYENIKFYVISTEDGEVVYESDDYESGITLNLGFSPKGNALYALIENEDGEMDLYALRLGELNLITTAVSIYPQFNENGAYLAYITGEDEEDQTLFVYNMSSGEEIEVMNGSNLSITFVTDPERMLISQLDDTEYTLFSATVMGEDLMELYSDDDVYLDSIYTYEDSPLIFLLVTNEDSMTNLYVTPSNEETGFYLLEDWASINLLDLSPDGKQLLFSAQEDWGDDEVLYLMDIVEDADPVELDDDADNGFLNGLFTANGKEVIYTATTGTDNDEVEVRKANLAKDNEVTVLYEEAYLQDVEWKSMFGFRYIYLSSVPYYGSSFCPGAATVTIDNPVSGTIQGDETACYKIELNANETVSITATSSSGADLYLTLYDADGYYINSDDDSGPDYDPWLRYTATSSGRYYIEISTYASSGGSFTLTVSSGTGNPVFDSAVPLYPYQTVSEYITYDDEVYIESLGLSTYGDMYYFEGNAGDYITIECSGYSSGSPLDPQIYLFDSNMNYLTEDDDSGDSYDSLISYYLSSTGTYYVLVASHYNDYGSGTSYWYDLYLSK